MITKACDILNALLYGVITKDEAINKLIRIGVPKEFAIKACEFAEKYRIAKEKLEQVIYNDP